MKFKTFASILAIILVISLAGCSSSSKHVAASITATSGSGQSAPIGTAFTSPLVATVLDKKSNPVSGATVTFTAPSSGASGIFTTSGTTTETDTTNSSGVATSSTFTANATFSTTAYAVTAAVTGVTTAASFSLTNTDAAASIAATSGGGQTATVTTAFANPLVATVLDSGSNPVVGATVVFTAPATGGSGTFANATNTETDVTDANGVATSSALTANGTGGSLGGPYNVVASVSGLTANFSLTNTGGIYSFYVTGLESINELAANTPNFYALAGSVLIDASGDIVGGEQDYNDGVAVTATDIIQPAAGALVPLGTTPGLYTLTLTTTDALVGVAGVETLGIQFVNTNHALISQFDGTATSSGSMDLQTLPSTPSGSYAFTLSGVDTGSAPVVYGGVFTVSGTTLSGSYDENDFGTVTLGTAFPSGVAISTPDTYGRGTVTGTGIGSAPLVYYIVGPEVMRIIDVGTEPVVSGDSAVGSAFGQGTGTFDNTSVGSSVFSVGSNPAGDELVLYAATGMFGTDGAGNITAGVADDDELGDGVGVVPDSIIGGTYSIQSTGYGSLTITPGDLGSVSALGIYLTDPNLNLLDPNNTTNGLGGGLIADLDATLNGTGLLIPQSDTTVADFTGSYAFGAQEYNNVTRSGWELDFVGQGSVASLALTGTGLISDPFYSLTGSATDPAATFGGTAVADGTNVGRFTLPLVVHPSTGRTSDFTVAIYQASGGQLFWLDESASHVFLGSLQQQGTLPVLSSAKKGAAKSKAKRKH